MKSARLNSLASFEIPEPSREAGLLRLQQFLKSAEGYGEARHYVREARTTVSHLSPYIRYRMLTERELVEGALAEYTYASVRPFIEQVCWRTYWKGYLEMRPSLWIQYLDSLPYLKEALSPEQHDTYQAACQGRTGIACMDAWSRMLLEQGWLHNHVRMWFASIWIFTLKLPWQLGADFFLQHLLDGDPASNTLSWRWVAGLHTRGRHYVARAENIRRFTEGAHFPEGRLNEDPELVPLDNPVDTQPLAEVGSLESVKWPSLSICPLGLLVTPEDLSPEFGELAESPFSSIAVFNARDVVQDCRPSPLVQSYVHLAVMDAAERLAQHWGGRVVSSERAVAPRQVRALPEHVGKRTPLRVYCGTVSDWEQSVLTWARNENLKAVGLLEPPTGPWADALPRLRRRLKLQGICLSVYRRRWDATHWPHATKGYFAFRKGLRERITGS